LFILQDYESTGIFEAQTELELKQKAEEDLLYEQFSVERATLKKHLEEEFQKEQEQSARELISSFTKNSPSKSKVHKVKNADKNDEQYQKQKDERLKASLERLTSEERLRVAKMIQKHSEEMLLMIAEKLAAKEVSSCSDGKVYN
jgi:hypothetical protein